jgi:multiple sugar transport system permease protein
MIKRVRQIRESGNTQKKIKSMIGMLFLYILLFQLVWVIMFPFVSRISASFMSISDMFDRTVNLIPRSPTLDNYRLVIEESRYWSATSRTFVLSLLVAIVQTFICSMTGYALSKLRGKLSAMVAGVVLLSVLVPPQVVLVPLYLSFRYFDTLDIFQLLHSIGISFGRMSNPDGTLNLLDSAWPLAVLSFTGFGIKNGLYILIMRQFFKGVPEEIEEAAMLDGAGAFRAYLRVVMPVSVPMLTTIFMLSFSWQWTDTFYSSIFFGHDFRVIARTIFTMRSASGGSFQNMFYQNAILHTGVMLAILPLILIYIAAQKKLVTGIERSGIVG